MRRESTPINCYVFLETKKKASQGKKTLREKDAEYIYEDFQKHLTVAYTRWFITFAMPAQYFNSKILPVAYSFRLQLSSQEAEVRRRIIKKSIALYTASHLHTTPGTSSWRKFFQLPSGDAALRAHYSNGNSANMEKSSLQSAPNQCQS